MPAVPQIQEKLAHLPDRPGVYLYRDEAGKVLYVGKAVNLKNRVRSYFQEGGGHTPRIALMVPRVRDIETIVTDSEIEALILESNLIKKHRPHYNVRLRDDKQYPYICLTMSEPFPRPIVVRRVKKDGNRYFGPYTNSWSMRLALKVIKQVFHMRTCSRQIEEGDQQKVCLDFHIGLCNGPCASLISRADYRRRVEEVCQFLEGRSDVVERQLKARMQEAAEGLNFEKAARLRDQLQAVLNVVERQKIVSTELSEQDVVTLVTDGVQTCVQLFFIRAGRLVGQEQRFLDGAHPEELPSAAGQFLGQYYAEAAQVPREILMSHEPEGQALIADWLRKLRGGKVELHAPQRGEKRRLVEMAEKNAMLAIEERRGRMAGDQAKADEAMFELAEALDLPNLPYRMEAFDISNLQGSEIVAAMVVFEGGQPKKADYRKFKIRTVEGKPDDFASMREVIGRRLERLEAGDEKFGETPDLILIDGGKGQLGAALEVARERGVELPMIGLAKQFEEIFLPDRPVPVRLPRSSQALFLLQRIRDEAHRFGLTYHRSLRSKAATASALDDIAGIGRKRREQLLKHFGSMEAMKRASLDDLAGVPGMTRPAADRVYQFLQSGQRQSTEAAAAGWRGGSSGARRGPANQQSAASGQQSAVRDERAAEHAES
jgi:excinuclease ABC subunit C